MDLILSDRDRVLLVGRSNQLGDWSYAKQRKSIRIFFNLRILSDFYEYTSCVENVQDGMTRHYIIFIWSCRCQ
ncbi:hypothetical protein SANA_05250 [Gottschalkiaceae bacterium SANA]|nr:hypothetical protein SANA_05250 [Gottschalkiaceae bacterium SANA]